MFGALGMIYTPDDERQQCAAFERINSGDFDNGANMDFVCDCIRLPGLCDEDRKDYTSDYLTEVGYVTVPIGWPVP